MLLLKLIIVPVFLLLISIAGRVWGASTAGWLAGLPIVGGPILFFIAFENDQAFALLASTAALSAVGASISFNLAYAHATRFFRWPLSLTVGLLTWLLVVLILSKLPEGVVFSATIAFFALLLSSRVFPKTQEIPSVYRSGKFELIFRMMVGATLVLLITMLAQKLGARWSGLLAVFPIPGLVLAVFSHRSIGAEYTQVLLKAFCTGLYAFATFTLVLSIALPTMNIGSSFLIATVSCLVVQAITKGILLGRVTGET